MIIILTNKTQVQIHVYKQKNCRIKEASLRGIQCNPSASWLLEHLHLFSVYLLHVTNAHWVSGVIGTTSQIETNPYGMDVI